MVYLVCLGPPGAGKGTQAKIIAEKFKLPHISTGDIFRQSVAENTLLGNKVKSILSTGTLVPDELVLSLVKHRIYQPDCHPGFVLDGFPRTLEQAEKFALIFRDFINNFDSDTSSSRLKVIYFNLPIPVVIQRLTARRTCPQCKRDYNLVTKSPRENGLCDFCHLPLSTRVDDNIESVTKRIQVYERDTLPLVEFYRNQNVITEISANQPIEQVTQQVLKVIETKL